jgi:branched-chain amino acid transport system ATP-binding protein
MGKRRSVTKGYTVVLVEQNFQFAAPLADRSYVMEHGQMVEEFDSSKLEDKLPLITNLLGV